MLPEVHRVDSGRPGSHVVILAGVHGDEDEGIVTAQRLIGRLGRDVETGRVSIVPVANGPAAVAHTRTSPLDGENLARVFPGDPAGTPTHRIAAFLTELMTGADLLIDLHSAGARYELVPWCGYIESGDEIASRSRAAAQAFGFEILWPHPHPPAPGRSIAVAHELGVPAIYGEAAGGGVLTEAIVSDYEQAVLRVLGSLAVTAPLPLRDSVWLAAGHGDGDRGVLAGVAGRFVGAVALGSDVHAGDALARVLTDDGEEATVVRAPHDGRLVLLRRHPRVLADDLVAMVARPSGA